MNKRQKLEQIAEGSCYEISNGSEPCHKCPVYKNGCKGFHEIVRRHQRFGELPESVRSVARAKLAEMDKAPDNSIIDIRPERNTVTLHCVRDGKWDFVVLTTAQFDALFDMVKAMKEVKDGK